MISETLAHYFSPDHIQGTVVALVAIIGVIAGGGALRARYVVTKRSVATEVVEENDEIRDKTVELLKEQNKVIIEQNELLKKNNEDLELKNAAFKESVDYLTMTVTNLGGKVDNLTYWFESLACLNAPGCLRRDCPNRQLISQMVAGEFSLDETSGPSL